MNVTEGSLTYEAQHDRWLLQYRIDGRRTKARGRTREAVYARKAEQVAAARGEQAEVLTITGALASFERSIGVRSGGTRRNYARAVGRLTDTVGDIPIADVTPEHAEQVLAAMAHDGLKATTLTAWLKATNPLFVWALKRGKVTANPLAGLRARDYGAADSDDPRMLDVGEARILTKYLTAHLTGPHVAHLLMLHAGLRISEAVGLPWDAVDLEARTIVVRQQADEAGTGVTAKLKTRSSKRVLKHLPATLIDVLTVWRDAAPEAATLVCSATATKRRPMSQPLSQRGVQVSLGKACERAGIEAVHPHGLRHTAGSLLYNVTKDLTYVADFLGHDDLVLVQRLYVHRVDEVDTGAMVDALLAS